MVGSSAAIGGRISGAKGEWVAHKSDAIASARTVPRSKMKGPLVLFFHWTMAETKGCHAPVLMAAVLLLRK
jgi:hypothetical protein